jgi:hypothetical protein
MSGCFGGGLGVGVWWAGVHSGVTGRDYDMGTWFEFGVGRQCLGTRNLSWASVWMIVACGGVCMQ